MIKTSSYSRSPYGRYRAKKAKEQKETGLRFRQVSKTAPYATIMLTERR